MDIREFYDQIGGNYNDLIIALGKEERIRKYLFKFPEVKIVEDLTAAFDSKDYETAFRVAHTLKGMSVNIGLLSLYSVSSELTESLRGGPKGNYEELAEKVIEEYNRTLSLITQIE